MQKFSSNVIALRPQQRAADIIESLELMLEQARNGELTGLVYAANYKPRKNAFGIGGDYCHDYDLAINAVSLLLSELHHINR